MQLDADKSCPDDQSEKVPTSGTKVTRRLKAAGGDLSNLSAPKLVQPYQLAVQLRENAQIYNCGLTQESRISTRDLEIVQQIGLEGLLFSIITGRRIAPALISTENILDYRNQIDAADDAAAKQTSFARGATKWIQSFGISPTEINVALVRLDRHLRDQSRHRRALLPRVPFDWNDAILAIFKGRELPLKLRSAAYALRAGNPALLSAIETDPFRASIALRKLLAPPQLCCEQESFERWREVYLQANVTRHRVELLALVRAPLLAIARNDKAIGLRMMALEGNDERLKRRAGAELMILGQTLPREVLTTIRALNCEVLVSQPSYEALERICKGEILPSRVSTLLGSPKRRFTVEEAEEALLIKANWHECFSSAYVYSSSASDGLDVAFLDLARRVPSALETSILDRLAEIDPEKSPNLRDIFAKALLIVRRERAKNG